MNITHLVKMKKNFLLIAGRIEPDAFSTQPRLLSLNMTNNAIIDQYPAAKFLRCFAAMVYDAFLIAAIMMLMLLVLGSVEGFLLKGSLPDFLKIGLMFLKKICTKNIGEFENSDS